MSNRITGDLAVSPDGKYIAVPTLALDNTSPADNDDGDQIRVGTPATLAAESDGLILQW